MGWTTSDPTPAERARNIVERGPDALSHAESFIANEIAEAERKVKARTAKEASVTAYHLCITRGEALEGRAAQIAFELAAKIRSELTKAK